MDKFLMDMMLVRMLIFAADHVSVAFNNSILDLLHAIKKIMPAILHCRQMVGRIH
jgi:hypothetical protein